MLAAASSGRFFLRSRKGGDLHRKLVGKFLKLSSGYKSIMIYLIINFVGIEPVSLSRLAFFSHDSEPVPHGIYRSISSIKRVTIMMDKKSTTSLFILKQ